MAKTLIGNIEGKDGRGIASIEKTGTTGSVDTYTIRYTDNTTSTYTVNNSDSVSLQRQIVPSAAVESSATASQAYAAGYYVVVNGVLRKVKSAIAKRDTIGDSNSTATTVTGEFADYVSSKVLYSSEDWIIDVTSGMVRVAAKGVHIGSRDWDSTNCSYTIPEQYRPAEDVSAAATTMNGGSWTGSLNVSTDGTVSMRNLGSSGSGDRRYASLVYPY